MKNAYEATEQAYLVKYLRIAWQNLTPAPMIAAIPNGGSRNILEGANLKKQGVLAGMPDLVIAAPDGRVIWLEMKSKSGKLSAPQETVHAHLAFLGHIVLVCHSAADALADLRTLGLLDGARIHA